MQKMMISGMRMLYGILSARTYMGMKAMLRMSSMTLAMYCEAMSPHTNSGFFSNRSGPGRSPHIMSPPSMMAVVADPGMPSVSMGTMARAEAALLADSGPATPSMAPLPNSAGCRDTFFAREYARNVAMVGPAPGSTPMKKPSTVPRTMAQRLRAQSPADSI